MADFASRNATDSDANSKMRDRSGGAPPPVVSPGASAPTASFPAGTGGSSSGGGGGVGGVNAPPPNLAIHERQSRVILIACVVVVVLLMLFSASTASNSNAAASTSSALAAAADKEKKDQQEKEQQAEQDARFQLIKQQALERKLANQVPYMSAEGRRKFVAYTQRKRRNQASNAGAKHLPNNQNKNDDDGADDKDGEKSSLHDHQQHNRRAETRATQFDPEAHEDNEKKDHHEDANAGERPEDEPTKKDDQHHGEESKQQEEDHHPSAPPPPPPPPPPTRVADHHKEEETPVEKKKDVEPTTEAAATSAAAVVENHSETSAPASSPLTSCFDWKFSCSAHQFVVITPTAKSPAHTGPPHCSFRSIANRSLDAGEYYGTGAYSKCAVPKLAKAPSKSSKDDPSSSSSMSVEDVAACFSVKPDKFPLLGQGQVIVVPQHGSGVGGGQKLACYNGPNDMVCKYYAQSFRWEPIVAEWLSYAAVMLRRFRHMQYLNFVRRLEKKLGLAGGDAVTAAAAAGGGAKTVQLEKMKLDGTNGAVQYFIDEFRPVLTSDVDPSAITDDNYGVELLDVGMHVGTMSNHLWRMGFPVKGFEPMPTNINLLLATRCLNKINTKFPSTEQCNAEFYHDKIIASSSSSSSSSSKTKKHTQHDDTGLGGGGSVADCLSQPVDLSSRSRVAHSRCPVAETVPFQLSYAGAGAKSGEVCVMFSDVGNIGDVLISCDKNLTEAAKSNDKIFIRDSWYTVRGMVTTQRLDDYIFRDQDAACTRHDEAGGVRFQHNAFRRQKELRNVVTRAVLARDEDRSMPKNAGGGGGGSGSGSEKKTQQRSNNKNNNNNKNRLLDDVFAATESFSEKRLNDATWRMRDVDDDKKAMSNGAKDIFLGSATMLPRVVRTKGNTSSAAAAGAAVVEEVKLAAPLSKLGSEQKEEIDRLIQELMPGEGFQYKDYIAKIDVEGHEANVIAGAEKLMSNPVLRPKILIIENWSHLNVTAFGITMVRYGYVGLSTRTFNWVHNELEAARHHMSLHSRGEPHDDLAWMPLKWAKILSVPEYHAKLAEKIGAPLEMLDAV